MSCNDTIGKMTISEVSRQLRAREVSPVELTRGCLERIERLNPLLNAFITVTAESALVEARRAEQEIQNGKWRGPLHGIPIALKDLIDTAGVPTTAASALFQDRVPTQDAEVVQKLRAAGAVILGKNNLHEFAYGGSSIISHFGPTRNPWNLECVTGGSSGGSAASVAARLCYAAIGTDTAGSIREPAAYCGVVGLKPTYNMVSARGVIPLSWSLDHVGPLVASVTDAALVLQALSEVPSIDYGSALDEQPTTLRIGIPRRFFYEELDPEISFAVDTALECLRSMVKATVEISIDVNTDRTLQLAESYEYHRQWVAESPGSYQPETLRRIRAGASVTADAFERAKRELAAERERIKQVFDEVDALITPTMPVVTPRIADLEQHPDRLRPTELKMLRNTRPFNVWGLPAISVPCGFTDAGLPIGLQIAAAPGREDIAFSLAHVYERATNWHCRRPELLAKHGF
jgi:aspartyl-tRNA(Asn)/glutamyl-tRNA(Gln) amidotransferase subunit A